MAQGTNSPAVTKRRMTGDPSLKTSLPDASADSTYNLPQVQHSPEAHEAPLSWFAALTTYFGYLVLILFGHTRDFFGKLTGQSRYFGANHRPPKGYAPLLQDWENFYTRRLYHRIQDCWNRPIAGPPYAGKIQVVERTSKDSNHTLNIKRSSDDEDAVVTRDCVNMGSYNYLGFADDWHKTCRNDVLATMASHPLSMCTSFADGGYTKLHRDLERSVAEFIGKEDALIFNMGWATNFLSIPSLMGKGCLIISDSLNHNSITAGCRTSGATIRVFKHNDLDGLESLIRTSIVDGQDRTHRPWKKILIVIEGIYSMEGEYCDLAPIVKLAKKYRCYTYLDEAHSIGAMGRTGRGVCEHCGVDPKDVDILMGTFTKSFGAMGGYIASSKDFIAHVRANSAGFLVDNAMSPVVCQQIMTAFNVIRGLDGTDTGAQKVARLRDNSNYMRSKLIAMGLEVLGDRDSPIMPILLYNPTKIAAFSRECLERGLAVVVVGFPATPLITSRARICISAGHTREDLDYALEKIAEVADVLKLRYRNSPYG